jgi:hypothetical protein
MPRINGVDPSKLEARLSSFSYEAGAPAVDVEVGA